MILKLYITSKTRNYNTTASHLNLHGTIQSYSTDTVHCILFMTFHLVKLISQLIGQR